MGYFISNLKRRHHNESQRAMVPAKIPRLRDGQRQVGNRGCAYRKSNPAILMVQSVTLSET
jgi:hypothetical protein